jgi:hypothetical protein
MICGKGTGWMAGDAGALILVPVWADDDAWLRRAFADDERDWTMGAKGLAHAGGLEEG